MHRGEILLVEDSLQDVELALRAFRKHRLVDLIHVVYDGAEALDFILGRGVYANRRRQDGLRVILLDLKLPKVDGVEVLRQIKADVQARLIPVVVLTSSRDDRDIAECYALGVNSYIVKPIDFSQFVEAVRILGLYWVSLNQLPAL